MQKILLLLLLFLYSCGGLSDLMLDLGGNYHYYGEGYSSNYIFYGKKDKNGTSIEKVIIEPSVESFTFDKDYILINQNPNLEWSAILLGNKLNSIARTFKRIDSFSFEKLPKHLQKRYLENLKDSIFYKKIALKITPQNTIEEQMYFRSLADSIIKIDKEYQRIFSNEINYWIIVKESKRVFGPYSKQQFLRTKRKLGVSKKLNLEE
jgi:hypothetical protein